MKIGILRTDINIPSEFFIKEETQKYAVYKPLYFCGTMKEIDGNKEDYYCESYLKIPFKNLHLPVFPKESIWIKSFDPKNKSCHQEVCFDTEAHT